MMHDLAALVLHLHFFLGVTVRQERIDVRQDVESDLVRIDFSGGRLAFDDLSTCRRSSSIAFAPVPETA